MKYEDARKLSRNELMELSKVEIIEALEDYMAQNYIITFDDSSIKFNHAKQKR